MKKGQYSSWAVSLESFQRGTWGGEGEFQSSIITLCDSTYANRGEIESAFDPSETMCSSNAPTDLPGQWPQFEILLSELSTSFTHLSAERVDGEISQSLQRVVESLGSDRATFLEFSEDKRQLHSRYSYAAPGYQPYPQAGVAEEPELCHDGIRRL